MEIYRNGRRSERENEGQDPKQLRYSALKLKAAIEGGRARVHRSGGFSKAGSGFSGCCPSTLDDSGVN